MAKIDIYTKPYCPYCERAKALLERKGADYNEIIASHDPELRSQMNSRSGRYTYRKSSSTTCMSAAATT